MTIETTLKIDGVVVLYFSGIETFTKNIPSYCKWLNRLYIIDNSGGGLDLLKQTDLESEFKNIEFIQSEYNYGIAKSLNIAAEKAIANDSDWLLTMDQDSYFEEDIFSRYINSISRVLEKFPNTAILSPLHILKNSKDVLYNNEFDQLRIAMTSGNLVNLNKYEKIGPFPEQLVIDYVDHEYGLRIMKKGYKTIRINNVKLIHDLGRFSTYKFLGMDITTSNHNKIRRYYMTRNRLYTMFKYILYVPDYFFFELKSGIIDVLKIIFLEQNKIGKLSYTFLGVYHAIIGKYGLLPESKSM